MHSPLFTWAQTLFMSIAVFVNVLSGVPVLLVTIFLIWYFRVFRKALKVFAIHHFAYLLLQIPAAILTENNMSSFFPFIHVYTLLVGCILLYFFRLILGVYLPRNTFLLVFLGYVVLTILNTLFIEPINTLNTLGLIFLSTLIIIFCLATFSLSMMSKELFLKDKWLVWIISGQFIMNSCIILTMSFSASLVEISTNYTEHMEIWIFHAFYLSIGHILYIVGFVHWRRQRKAAN